MEILAKVKPKGIAERLDSLANRNMATMQVALRQWFDFTLKQTRSDISRKFKKDITSELTNWSLVEEGGKKIIKPAALKIMQTGGQEAYKLLAIKGTFDILNVNSVRVAEKFTAKLVTNVNKETKKAIRAHIANGIKEGKSMPKIGRELRNVVGLNGVQAKAAINYRRILHEKYPGLSATDLDTKMIKYQGKMLRQRGVNIARTETARAQNMGYTQGLEDVGVVEVEFLVAAGACGICETLNGTRYPVEKAGDVIPVHPNCRCCMLPVVGDETISQTLAYAPPELPGALASEEGMLPWKQYLNMHRGEKSNSAILYDFYKVRYETTGKLSSSGLKHLKAHAVKFEATSVRISKPIPGLGDLIKPIKVPPGPKPPDFAPKPPVPKPRALTQKEWEASITPAEKKAMGYWTKSYDEYQDLQAMLAMTEKQLISAGYETWEIQLYKNFKAVLARSPQYKGTVYRGIAVDDLTIVNKFKKGKTITFDAYTPASELEKVANNFMKFYAEEGVQYPIKLRIKTQTGTALGKFSDKATLRYNQREVVLHAKTKYKVTNTEWKYDAKIGKKTLTVDMEEIVAKPKPPGLLPKSYFDDVTDWDEHLIAHKASLRERMGFDIEALKVHRTDLPEYKEALKKFEAALKSYTKPTSKVDDISRAYYPASGRMKTPMQNLNKFYDKIEEIGCDDAIKMWNRAGVTIDIHSPGYRANAHIRQYRIAMARSDRINVYFHELGHLIESNPSAKRKALAWIKARGKGVRLDYNKLVTWTTDKQMCYKDKFIDPYVGKYYRDGATEALSMGMQQFTSYKQMMRFAKKDFDHFSFIHGILTGAI